MSTVRVFYHRNALKLLLMLVSILLAFLTALSRISDYDHHPLDILSGMIIGSGVAVAVVSKETVLVIYCMIAQYTQK